MNSNDYISRPLETYAFDENLTGRHMVFIAGPRQTEKTRLAKQWLYKNDCSPLYFNWDDLQTRQAEFTEILPGSDSGYVRSHSLRCE